MGKNSSTKRINSDSSTQESTRTYHHANTMIDDFARLVAVVFVDARFESFDIQMVDDDCFYLLRDEIKIYFCGPERWTKADLLEQTVQQSSNPNQMVVCCGREEDFAGFAEPLQSAHVHQLLLPSSIRLIEFHIQGLFRSQHWHEQASAEKREADTTLQNVRYVLSVSRELNGIRDVNRLLSLILAKAREVTHADAGSIYVVEPEEARKERSIVFKITQNQSVNLHLNEFRMPITENSIVGNAVIQAKAINIPDLYATDHPNPEIKRYQSLYDRSWDLRNGYKCHSMLTIPMFDISHTVIGVIQLINCKIGPDPLLTPHDFQTRVQGFDETAVEYADIVAYQAGIALENALLTEEKEALFRGFVDASVKAIEQRDPTTSGHSHRVARLTIKLAQTVDQMSAGVFRNVKFSEHQMKEIEYASLLHDFGKLGVREQVLLKSKKLYPWELELLTERFELIRARLQIKSLEETISFLRNPRHYPPGIDLAAFESQFQSKVQELDELYQFILRANEPTVLEQGGFERLKDVANLTFCDSKSDCRPYLKDNETKALMVSRGSLTAEEFAEIQSHVLHTYEFLRKIPWGKNLQNIPQIAAKHHEKLDGTGYPGAAHGQEIPIQSRMMSIADIFDALTAADRPYKKSVPREKALDIIGIDVRAGKCDADLFQIFIESECYKVVGL